MKEGCSSRFVSIYDSLVEPGFVGEFAQTLGLEDAPFREQRNQNPSDFGRSSRAKVRGLTPRAKFKRLLSEQYFELYTLNGQYKDAYEDLYHECKAVNFNLKKFQNRT